MSLRGERLVATPIILLTLLLGFTGSARSQVSTADILGTITDSSGAIISGATVTIVNLDTRAELTDTTNETGGFLFPNLPPGRYNVSITDKGFQTSNLPELMLAAGDRHRVDAHLSVGTSSETVQVTSSSPALQTDSSAVASTVTEHAVLNLPLNGRNYINLAQLTPGANEGPSTALSGGGRPDDRRQSSSISVNGQSDVLNDEEIDGMDNNERIIGTIGVRPSIDAIAEIRVLTNSYEADAGRAAGAIVNIITKSGTNHFHGSLYEFFRNNALDAYAYQFGAHGPKTELRQNQFGGSLGGPIVRDRTFFFVDLELFRLVQGTTPSSSPVPTLFEHNNPGNFSDLLTPGLSAACAAAPAFVPALQNPNCVYDKYTGAFIPSNIVPVAQRDPIGLDYLAMFPAPNSGTNEYVGSRVGTQYSRVYDVRVDHKITASDQIFARFTENDVDTFTPSSPFPITTVAGLSIDPGAGFAGDSPQTARNIQVNYSHTFTPNLLLTAGAGYTFISNLSNPLNFGLNPNTAFGQPNINISQMTSGLAPVNVIGGSSLAMGDFLEPLHDKDNTYQVNGAVFYSVGKHSIKIGGALIRRHALNLQDTFGEGYFVFPGYSGLASGVYLAALRNNDLYPPTYETWEPTGFIQDDWHVAQKLTLNLGARYEVFTPFTEAHNHISNFDQANTTVVQASVDGVSRTAGVKTDYSNFSPRAGFSYSATPSTVIRGGFGLSFFPENYTGPASLKNQPNVYSYGSCMSRQTTGGCQADFTYFQEGLPLPTLTSTTNLSGGIPGGVAFNFRSGYLEQFNLTAQQQIGQAVLTVSYVGQLGRRLFDSIADINRVPVVNGSTNGQVRRYSAQLPNVTAIGELYSNSASNYNALQASFERRFTNGLGFGANTTWAHNLDNFTTLSGAGQYGEGTAQVLATHSTDDYSNSDLDQRNRVVVTANYAPTYGKSLHGISGVLAKGWQGNLLYVWSSGLPGTIVNGSNVSGTSPGGNDDRPDQIAPTFGANLVNPQPLKTPSEYFNTAAFVQQAPGTIGSARRNSVEGPPFRHLDISVFKDFVLTGRFQLQFRTEVFNVANQTNFAAPVNVLTAPNFGQLAATALNYNPRIIQFALRLTF